MIRNKLARKLVSDVCSEPELVAMLKRATEESGSSVIYEFCDSTSFHGFDFIRPQQSTAVKLFWTLIALAGIGATLAITASLVSSYRQQPTGVNQVLLDTVPSLPSIRICYDAYLPEQASHYPPPMPGHVYEFLVKQGLLGDLLRFSSGLWPREEMFFIGTFRPSAGLRQPNDDSLTKAYAGPKRSDEEHLLSWLKSGFPKYDESTTVKSLVRAKEVLGESGSTEEEQRRFTADTFAAKRPPDTQLMNRSDYEELLSKANASSFPELIIKLLPQANYPLVVLNSAKESERAQWTLKTYLTTNRRELCQQFLPKPQSQPTSLDLVFIFPPVFINTRDIQLGRVHFDIRDSQGLRIYSLRRPMAESKEFIGPGNSRYQVAQGRIPESVLTKAENFSSLYRHSLHIVSRHNQLLDRRTFRCREGLEPEPTVRDLNLPRQPRNVFNKTCRPMDEVFVDTEARESWKGICDPWELRELETRYLQDNYKAESTLAVTEPATTPTTVETTALTARPPLSPLVHRPTFYYPSTLTSLTASVSTTTTKETPTTINREARFKSVVLQPGQVEAFGEWISRRANNLSSATFCRSAVYTVAEEELTQEPFYSQDALFAATFRRPEDAAHYSAMLQQHYGEFANAQLAQVRLEMRGLPGDNVVVEQFLLMGMDNLFSQLGGFVGLFMGGSVISIVHLFFYAASAASGSWTSGSKTKVQRLDSAVNARRDQAKTRQNRLLAAGSTILFLLLIGLSVAFLVVVMKDDEGKGDDESKHLQKFIDTSEFNRAAFFNFTSVEVDERVLGGCGGVPTKYLVAFGESVEIKSPNYPNRYTSGAKCRFTVASRPGIFPVTLVIDDFTMEEPYDSLKWLNAYGDTVYSCSGSDGQACQAGMPDASPAIRMEMESDQDPSALSAWSLYPAGAVDGAGEQLDPPQPTGPQSNVEPAAAYERCVAEAREPKGAGQGAEVVGGVCLWATAKEASWAESFCACRRRGAQLASPQPQRLTEAQLLNVLSSFTSSLPDQRMLWLGGTADGETAADCDACFNCRSPFLWHRGAGDDAPVDPRGPAWASNSDGTRRDERCLAAVVTSESGGGGADGQASLNRITATDCSSKLPFVCLFKPSAENMTEANDTLAGVSDELSSGFARSPWPTMSVGFPPTGASAVSPSCTVQPNFGRDGTYSQIGSGSVQECCTQCAADSRCLTGAYHDGQKTCYLQDEASYSGLPSVRPDLDTVTPNRPACSVQANYGRDGAYDQVATTSREECCRLCAEDGRCLTGAFDGQTCFLQDGGSYTSGPFARSDIDTLTPQVPRCAVQLHFSKGGYYAIVFQTPSTQECCDLCAADARCVTGVFVVREARCYLQDTASYSTAAAASRDSHTVTPNRGSCAVQPNYGRHGAYHSAPAGTAQECCHLCARDRRCETGAFVDTEQRCHLQDKDSYTSGPGVKSSMDTVMPVRGGCEVKSNFGREGAFGQLLSFSTEECCSQCSADPSCLTGAFHGGQKQCYFQSAASYTSNGTSGRGLSTVRPERASCTVQPKFGRDGAYHQVVSFSPQDCCFQCAADTRCLTSTFHSGHKVCYLQDKAHYTTAARASEDLDTCTPKRANCAARFNHGRSGHYKQVGSSSPEECCEQCASDGDCEAAAFSCGARQCYLQNTASYTSEAFERTDISTLTPGRP